MSPQSSPRSVFSRDVAVANRHRRLRVPRGAVERIIALLDEGFRFLPADAPHLSPAGRRRLREQKPKRLPIPAAAPAGELSIVFLDDAALAELHADFLDDPTTTDVITFEGDEAAGLAGEICVSADTAARYAREHGGAFARELTLYLVHGWLHLCGYDDLKPVKKRRMRLAEARALRLLEAADAIPAFALRAAGAPAKAANRRRQRTTAVR